jgi:hypothetical protein
MTERPTGRTGGTRFLRGRPGAKALAGVSMAACAVVVIGIAAGRDGGNGSSKATTFAGPQCAGVRQFVDRPGSVPADLLPPGTALTSLMNLPQDRTLVTGVIPLEFRTAVDFYVSKLPAAGYQLGAGDAEQDEAEALFLGESVRGKWKVNAMLNCPDAVTLTLLVGR